MPRKARRTRVLVRAVATVEKEIADNDFETAAVFARDGTLLLHKAGERAAVRFLRQEVLQMIDAAVFTHNHPRNTSFSLADIDLAWRLRIGELRVISPHFLYRMRPPPGGWRQIEWQVIEETVTEVRQQVLQEFQALLRLGRLTEAEADLRGWHTIWLRVARRLALSYTRRRR
jgi:hypothetical protein